MIYLLIFIYLFVGFILWISVHWARRRYSKDERERLDYDYLSVFCLFMWPIIFVLVPIAILVLLIFLIVHILNKFPDWFLDKLKL